MLTRLPLSTVWNSLHPELLEAKLIDYDFIWSGENKTAIVDKFTNEIANAENLKQ